MNTVATEIARSYARETWRLRRMAMEADGRFFTVKGPKGDSPLTPLLRGADRLMRATGLDRHGRRNALDLSLNRVRLRFADLPPAFHGFTILHLSDLHVDVLPEATRRAAAMVAGLEVDLTVMTGDYQTEGSPVGERVAESLGPLLRAQRSRHGVLAVLGNHDGHEMADVLEGLGAEVLVNQHASLRRGGQRLHVTGTDDVHRFHTPEADHALLHGPEGFRLALVHSPELAGVAERAGIRLYLSGHTHGGQVCLPGGRPLITATVAHGRLAAGHWRLGALQGYTSRGVGAGPPAVRYNCRGEVALITLVRG